ncbi:MAG TPA: IS630 family transposase [Verrucomicrobiae bacterium]|nr:IS630 family transposase [Verrucomicrobiae bacterium]
MPARIRPNAEQRDGRALAHDTLAEIRIRAVQRVVDGGESPELVIRTLGFHRSVMYERLARFRKGGVAALGAQPIPGRPCKLTAAQLRTLVRLLDGKNPLQLRFQFALWTRAMIQELIWRQFEVSYSESAVGRLLRRLGYTPQCPLFRAYQQDPEAVQRWLDTAYPAIQRLARTEGATIYFEDEAGIRSDHHGGTTWVRRGETPIVRTTGARFALNMLSAIAAQGQMRFMVTDQRVNASEFLTFLTRLLHNQDGPVFLIVDGHPSHRAHLVRDYVATTNGRLRLFYPPSDSPELNPDEWVWRHVKTQRVGRQVITGPAQLDQLVHHALRRLQRVPQAVRGFFYAPDLRSVLRGVG